MSYKAGILAAVAALTNDEFTEVEIKTQMQAILPSHRKWSNGTFRAALMKAVTDGSIEQRSKKYGLPIKKKGRVKQSARAMKKRTSRPSAIKTKTKANQTTPLLPPEHNYEASKRRIDALIDDASRTLNGILKNHSEQERQDGANIVNELDELDMKSEAASEARCQEQMEDDLRQELQRADREESRERARRFARTAAAVSNNVKPNQHKTIPPIIINTTTEAQVSIRSKITAGIVAPPKHNMPANNTTRETTKRVSLCEVGTPERQEGAGESRVKETTTQTKIYTEIKGCTSMNGEKDTDDDEGVKRVTTTELKGCGTTKGEKMKRTHTATLAELKGWTIPKYDSQTNNIMTIKWQYDNATAKRETMNNGTGTNDVPMLTNVEIAQNEMKQTEVYTQHYLLKPPPERDRVKWYSRGQKIPWTCTPQHGIERVC